MKLRFLFPMLFLSVSTYNAQTLDCPKFKEGKFSYSNHYGKISLREGNTQKSFTDGKLQAIWKVVWISECEYELICKKVIDKSMPFKKGDRIVATIIETEEHCYTTSNVLYNDQNPRGISVSNSTLCFYDF